MELDGQSNQQQQQQQELHLEKEGYEYIDILLENLEQLRPFASGTNFSTNFSQNDVYMLYKIVAEEFSEKLRQSLLDGDNVEYLIHFPDLLEIYCTVDRNSQAPNVISNGLLIYQF
ncbi:unnamed protein product [Onchocerca flexuosa]|uniref:Uncharacterized protein n=1 Tax=Onchocerca flexuosa TaxID=387005 RepID=A0A183HXK0_9BILA|nr:unnamed protein product [Onchocerca flexuosa]